MEHKKNILIGCTGSVAAIKLPVVLNLLKKRDQSFQVSTTHGSLIFFHTSIYVPVRMQTFL
jgi:phosphopantothenoylcysteine synthetase/decarboxylase